MGLDLALDHLIDEESNPYRHRSGFALENLQHNDTDNPTLVLSQALKDSRVEHEITLHVAEERMQLIVDGDAVTEWRESMPPSWEKNGDPQHLSRPTIEQRAWGFGFFSQFRFTKIEVTSLASDAFSQERHPRFILGNPQSDNTLPILATLDGEEVPFYNTTRGGRDLPTTDGPAAATKDEPFENSLGMRFVPVPITGGPTDGGARPLLDLGDPPPRLAGVGGGDRGRKDARDGVGAGGIRAGGRPPDPERWNDGYCPLLQLAHPPRPGLRHHWVHRSLPPSHRSRMELRRGDRAIWRTRRRARRASTSGSPATILGGGTSRYLRPWRRTLPARSSREKMTRQPQERGRQRSASDFGVRRRLSEDIPGRLLPPE